MQVTTRRSNSIDIMRRRRAGKQNISRPAIADAPARPQGVPLVECGRAVVVVVDVVATVRVEVPTELAVNVRVVGLRLQVGTYWAPVGELVKVQLRFIVPE
jgi:hypothetical protein